MLSRQLALEVIAQLKLNDLPEFDPVLRPTSILRHILSLLGISRDLMAMTPEERVLEHLSAAAGTHLDPRVVNTFLQAQPGRDER